MSRLSRPAECALPESIGARLTMASSAVSFTNFQRAHVYLEQETEDSMLVRQVRAGDVEAFEPLVRRYQRPVFSLALRVLGDRGDAEDATQNAFVKAYQNLGTYKPGYRFFTWFYRIALNECLNAKRDRRDRSCALVELAEAPAAPDALEAEERRRQVRDAILSLPLDYRKVVVLRHFADLSYDEMSAALRIPTKTVKSRLYSARRQLVRRLKGVVP